MSYLGERFGFDEVYLTVDERIKVDEQIKNSDHKRLDFFSILSA